MAIKKGDFIELEYTGYVKDNNYVFDTTNETVAKDNGIHTEKMTYGPVVVCLGQSHLLAGLDDFLTGKEIGSYKATIQTENAFGKKSAKLLRLIPIKIFHEQKIAPRTGLEINIDGMNGIVRSVGGGRVIVDFNHPLSGKDVVYDVKVIREVTLPIEQIKSLMALELNLKNADVIVDGEKGVIKANIPENIVAFFKERILKLVPQIKELNFLKDEKSLKN
ncbi:MAG: FKBP-type peptidyl-prolyl cis-trans isomerase [archaeon]